jgi:peptidoglycan/LPS O-acetylase OafA/YrhL
MAGFYPVWAYFFCMVLLFLIARLPLFAMADSPPHATAERVSTLDGLRGILALSVFFHHAMITHGFLLSGEWVRPPSQFYTDIGHVGVEIFFMITGYLFWRILIKAGGKPDWIKLYISRLFRIGPLYLFAANAALITIFCSTGFVLHDTVFRFLKSLIHLESLGALAVC